MVDGVEDGVLDLVQTLRERIAEWRLGKLQVRERMPEELWIEAVALGQVLGASKASRMLGVGYVTLRQRIEAGHQDVGASDRGVGGAFVEVQPWAGGGPLRVEVERPDGCRLRLEVSGGITEDTLLLVQSFLKQAV